MSNARIVEQLNVVAENLESGQLSVTDFRDQILGQTAAVERIPYSMVKEAQHIWGQLTNAIDEGKAQLVDVKALGDWVRGWALRVPCEAGER